MLTQKLTTRIFWTLECVLLLVSVGGAALLSRTDEWGPPALLGLILVLALLGQRLSVQTRSGELSASLVALVLTMSLLGVAPAVALGGGAMVLKSAVRRLPPAQWLNNLSTFTLFPFVGGVLIRTLAGNVHDPQNHQLTQSVTFGLIVFGVFLATIVLNFVMVAIDVWLDEGYALTRQVREQFFPTLPGQLATGALATILAVAYANLGLPVLFGAVALLLVFQQLTVALLRSEDRADQLEARSIQLASLQFGVLATLMDALALRDRSTATHAASVARYAKALAVEVGCSEEEQEVSSPGQTACCTPRR
jgi:hypothetical protein